MRPITVVLWSCCAIGTVSAETLTVYGSLYAEHQSNIVASTLDPQEGSLGRVRLEVGGEDLAESYAWTLNGKFSYQMYESQILATCAGLSGRKALTGILIILSPWRCWILGVLVRRTISNLCVFLARALFFGNASGSPMSW